MQNLNLTNIFRVQAFLFYALVTCGLRQNLKICGEVEVLEGTVPSRTAAFIGLQKFQSQGFTSDDDVR